MSPLLISSVVVLYFLLLLFISWFTSRNADSSTFYVGNKQSPWYVVAFGMIGASLSGVTFMSVPGWVKDTQFSYLMMVFGYLLGYFVIATILMPLYYRLNLTTIYTYLEKRFGFWSYKTGAFFFLLSRSIGASFRMYIVINVLQIFIFDQWNLPFWIPTTLFILLVIIYTFQGGIKTIVWTDTLQTTFMLATVFLSIYFISQELGFSLNSLIDKVLESETSKIIFTDWNDKRHFLKQFLSGTFTAIAMTGLDQEMMQKNLSCKTLKDAQKNMFSFSFVLVFVNFMFLFLGAIIYMYVAAKGISIPQTTDDVFPTIALKYLQPIAGLIFIIGLISAAFPSADGALTSLTTSFCVDFLNLKKKTHLSEREIKKTRYFVHFSFAFLLLCLIVLFKTINDQAVIQKLFTVAGYTYGPLLGLFAFGLFTKLNVRDKFVPCVAILSPIICFLLSTHSTIWFNGYKFGFELLILNGLITFLGLFFLSLKKN